MKYNLTALIVLLQKLLNEKNTLIQTVRGHEEPEIPIGKPDRPAKKGHGKVVKGPPFICKPDVIWFKVPHCYSFKHHSTLYLII